MTSKLSAMTIPSVNILGVPVSRVTMEFAVQAIDQFLIDGNQHLVTTPNPEMIVAAQHDAEFMQVLNQADLATPDGTGILWAAWFLQKKRTMPTLTGVLSLLAFPLHPHPYPLSRRVTGVDLVTELARHFEDASVSLFLLGSAEGVAAEAKQKLLQKFPHLTIAGTYSGSPTDTHAIELINEAKPDILLVAFGNGKQEKWIWQNLKIMPSIKVAIGVGGTFDFLAGRAKRAPHWVRLMRIEWLWRLITEPRRFRRIITATVTFPKLVMRQHNGETVRANNRNTIRK